MFIQFLKFHFKEKLLPLIFFTILSISPQNKKLKWKNKNKNMKFLACFFGVFYFSLEIISTSHSAINPFSLPDSRFLSSLIISIIKIKGLDLSVVPEQSVSLEGEEVGVDGREADSEGRKLSTRIIASHMQPFNYLKFKKKQLSQSFSRTRK